METFWLKIVVTPVLIGAASLAGRRWGQAVSGWFVGLPLTSGPIALFVALDHGAGFAAATAVGALAAATAEAAFCLAYAHTARRWRWPPCLTAACIAFSATAVILQPLALPVIAVAVIVFASLVFALPYTMSAGGSGMPNRFADFKVRPRPSTSARAFPSGASEFLLRYRDDGEARLAQPFTGITADGAIATGLFKIEKTGVSTGPIKAAADAYLASLGPHEREHTLFSVDADAWRRWSNIHPFVMRHGVCLDTMSQTQRERALALLQASLSAQGFETARGVMKLNDAIREITGRDDEYGEWLYWLSIMGTPSDDGPWGWQIDGHHLIVNCFVLGDQVVMTPMFMGSEPVAVDEGRHAGTRVFEVEERDGLALVRALTDAQRAKTVLGDTLPTEVFTAAFRDNVELGYQGIRYGDLSSGQQRLMLGLVETYVGRIRPGHAAVKMDEVARYLADTRFAWIGGVRDDSVFYYRIHSPVVLIEFDHQRGIALDNDQPARTHIHTVIRTPNGNDYGRDLLRQHHAEFDHSRPGHSHG